MSPSSAPPLTLYFIRHGQTEWSLSGRHTGRTEIELTPHGEDEAGALRPWLASVTFSHVLSSPRRRARRTCELAGLGAEPEIEPDLAEWDYGDYEGRTAKDIRAERPGWRVFHDGCPNGEMPADIGARVDRLIARLSTLEGNVALVAHGHLGMVLATRWIGLPVSAGRNFTLQTGSLNILGRDAGHDDVPAIALWNATPRRFGGDT